MPSKQIDCDPTYSIGNFYKNTGIDEPIHKFDINPQVEGVEFGDSRHLPLSNNSISCMMFVPPFLSTTGKSLTENKAGDMMDEYLEENDYNELMTVLLTELAKSLGYDIDEAQAEDEEKDEEEAGK